MKEIYEQTKNAIRVHDNTTECFWTGEGVRQGCLLNPLLFALVIADVIEKIKKRQIRRVLIRRDRIWTLAYDLVLSVKNEENMKEIIKRLDKYLKDKNLELNTEKSKILYFKKGGGRNRRVKWMLNEKEIEEVSEFK